MKAILLLISSFFLAAFASDLITSLPGTSVVSFKQYAGYVNIDAAADRNMFYWFTESQRSPVADPVVLWLAGGPGCSSLVALFQELGPFTVNVDGSTLSRNPYSWNTVANIIFVDAPIGTGFSYSTAPLNEQNDTTTAADMYAFLQGFFHRYPRFLINPFFIAGEGYAVHILPYLATNILNGQSTLNINFNGLILGNPFTDSPMVAYSQLTAAYTANLVGDQINNEVNQACGNILQTGVADLSTPCFNAIVRWREQLRDLNYFGMYDDLCLDSIGGVEFDKREDDSDNILRNIVSPRLSQSPCIDNYITEYLNLDSVKAAIHANPDVNFTACSNAINYGGPGLLFSMNPIILSQLQSGIPYLIYSGDTDLYVPTLATRLMINSFNMSTTFQWHTWIDSNNQIGGFTQSYETNGFGALYFVTVKGANHYVPGSQPVKALDMITRYLEAVPF